MNLVVLFTSDFVECSSTSVRLEGRRKEHLLSICRVKVGSHLRVGLLDGLMGDGVVKSITGDWIDVDVTLDTPPPPALPVTLILSLPRPKSLKKALEFATALGVKTIIIVESWRVEKSYWTSPVLSELVLRNHMICGLEQAHDTVLPKILIRRRFKPFVEDESGAVIAGTMALVAHPYAAELCPRAPGTTVTLAIGPEGGYIPYEIDLLKEHGFQPVSIGGRVLRVECAIPALLGKLL